MGTKNRINGIKASRELTQIELWHPPKETFMTANFLRIMSEQRINLTFISFTSGSQIIKSSYCFALEDTPKVENIISHDFSYQSSVNFLSPVGSVSLYPHKFNFEIIGQLITIFGKTGFPLYGMATSLSSVSLITDFHLIPAVVELIKSDLMIE